MSNNNTPRKLAYLSGALIGEVRDRYGIAAAIVIMRAATDRVILEMAKESETGDE